MLVIVLGLFFGAVAAQGSYLYGFLIAVALGAALAAIARLGRVRHTGLAIVAGLLTALGVLVWGHAVGYQEARDAAYHHVQRESTGRFDPAWKALPREQLFPLYMARMLEEPVPDASVRTYLRFQASVGFEERVRGRRRISVGPWVWIGWIAQVPIMLAGAVAGAVLGTLPGEEPRSRRAARPAPARGTT